ncbi:uncharacterized protein N7482_001536 [Penicillium canariense]|uniref:Rho-GAP domain-containing protein n=1 Tax=Penicillium canariense TaxID=189055 RepID=A0A9W9IDK1_9EURO|nr:uncharacterized protein N7482_001536 [Penicillium canariense]KAJ5175659.1 hypothetical protein N7482_001536 [Penicillium canariense]
MPWLVPEDVRGSSPKQDDTFNKKDSTQPGSHRDQVIQWLPSLETHLARSCALASLGERLPTTVPVGFPDLIKSDRDWSGSNFESEGDYVYILSPEDLAESETALHSFLALSSNPDLDQISPETFPLPQLGVKLRELSETVHVGRGFCIIRGIDPTRYSPIESMILYAGITSYIGSTRACQDDRGNRVIHIKDRGRDFPGVDHRQPPYSNVGQPFHSDHCDIVALFFVDTAAQGGSSKLASSAKIYNEIAATRPDVIHILASNTWKFDNWEIRPILLDFGPYGPAFCFSRRSLTGSPYATRQVEVPPLTERQAEALDLVQFTAAKHALSMQLQPGDIQIVNNWAALHSRDGFTDNPKPGGKRRHALRLWLRNEENAWPTPGPLEHIWKEIYSKDSPWAKDPHWDLVPPIDWQHASKLDFTSLENFYHNVNSVAGLVKQFFRDPPEPLFTSYLPDAHYAILRAVILHLNKVQEHYTSNRMSAGSLAIYFGPTLMSANSGGNIADAGWQVRMIETILNNTFQIFDDD